MKPARGTSQAKYVPLPGWPLLLVGHGYLSRISAPVRGQNGPPPIALHQHRTAIYDQRLAGAVGLLHEVEVGFGDVGR
ncbi:MAG: hypothetical protein EOO61_07185, partial [Hymenobacter sp.]